MSNHLPTLQDYHQVENLELIARQVVEGFIIGLHKSPFHGFSVEFAEHRLYNPGESTRHIDWKVFARTDRMYSKRYEEETNLRCQIVLDASSSMYFPEKEGYGRDYPGSKIQFAVVSAAAIMHMMRKQRDAVGMSVFRDQLDEHTRARSSQVHHKLLLSYLEKLMKEKDRNHTTRAAQSLHQIAESIPKRSLVILFSDMLEGREDQQEIFAALQHLRYCKHEVVLFHVVDRKKELDFEFENRPYLFVDIETGEKVKLQARQVKEQYVRQIKEFKKELALRCGQYEIDFVEADINQGFRQVLYPYLVKRMRMK